MTTTSSRRQARRRHSRRLLAHRSAIVGGAALAGLLLPLTGLAAANAADPVDEVPPLLDLFMFAANPDGWYDSDPNFRVVANDEGRGGSGIRSISYILDGAPVQTVVGDPASVRFPLSIDLSAEGVHDIEIWTTDTAGNESFHQTATVRVDLTTPYISVPADGRFEVGEVAFLPYSCGDLLSGIDLCTGPVDAGAQLDTTSPGTFTVPVTGTDRAGNSSTVVYTYTVVGPDIDGPRIDFGVAPEPASGWYRSYLGIAFSATDPSGVASMHWTSDGAFASNGDAVMDNWIGFDLTVDGITEVQGWAFDAFGNRTETERRTIRIDTVQPTITINSPTLPAGGSLVVQQGAAVPLDYTCDDAHSGVQSCIDQGELPALVAASALPTAELGDHTITVRALDIAGNESAVEIPYTVVAKAPTTGGAVSAGAPTPARPGTLAATGAEFSPAGLITGIAVAAAGLVLALRNRKRVDAE